jgi:hypothetical protein
MKSAARELRFCNIGELQNHGARVSPLFADLLFVASSPLKKIDGIAAGSE